MISPLQGYFNLKWFVKTSTGRGTEEVACVRFPIRIV